MIIDAQNLEFGEHDINELPQIPEEYQKLLGEWGGFTGEHQNVRLVSGLDPTLKDWNGGRWWLRYAFKNVETHAYYILHKSDGTKQILSEEAGRKLKNPEGILIPVVEEEIQEFPIPRYFTEVYKPPTKFGNPKDWEKHRWMSVDDPANDTGSLIDLMGEYPYNGEYETWFCIEDLEVKDGITTGSKIRYLDDEVMMFIKERIEASQKTVKEKVNLRAEKRKEEEEKRTKKFSERIYHKIKERATRLTGGIQVAVPKNYGSNKTSR